MTAKKNICVVGAQWGDEGKGKIVDLLAGGVDIVARYQGGANAGHTVRVHDREFVLHLVPSGIVHPRVQCLIGNGVVIDPRSLIEEMALLRKQGIEIAGRLHISANAHLTLPYHIRIDQARESQRGGAIGTTHRGIGPTYTDKAARTGITVGDLVRGQPFVEKLRRNFAEKNFLLQNYYHQRSISYSEILNDYKKYIPKLRPLVCDGPAWLDRMMKQGRRVLFEGAQGTFLDVDFGTYPFVTSSSTITGGACIGLGVGPDKIGQVILVAKAYTTRVGHGPFPTEFEPRMAELIRAKAGDEFGRTTGRPRRCGWFDAVMVRRAVKLNGASDLAITKLDVLDGLKQLKIAVEYRGYHRDEYPWSAAELERCRAGYLTLPGWNQRTSGVRRYQDLPANAKRYIQKIEQLTGARVSMISVGAERRETIVR